MKKTMRLTIIGLILFLLIPITAGCAKIEHRMVGIGDYKYDSINGLIYEKNEFGKWVPTGEKIYFKGEFR